MSATDKLSRAKVDAFVKASSAGKAATRKLADGGGLYLTVTAAGSPVWRIKYRIAGTERLYAVGVYPDVSLDEARRTRATVRAQLRDNRDPMLERRIARQERATAAAVTFESVALAWLEKEKPAWSAIHYRQSKRALERDVFPKLGKVPVDSITTPAIARVIEKINERGASETASKVLWNVQKVFDYAATRDGATRRDNPAIAARQVLLKRRKYTKRPAFLRFDLLGDVLRRADKAPLSPSVRMCHRLIAFTAVRIGNAVTAKWEDFDLDGDVPKWTLPRSTMKVRTGREDHTVVLGPAIAAELRAWRKTTGGRGFVFPPPYGDKPHITRESVEKAYRKTLELDGQHSVHGWRASFSTLARDEGGFAKEVVEIALDHVHASDVVLAYDRGTRLKERVKLAKWWNSQLVAAQVSR